MDNFGLKSDLELIDSVKNNKDNNSFIELSNRHSPLCISIYNKYSNSITASGISIEDLKEDKDMIVYKSILSYNPDKNVKFSTWLGNQIRFHCLNSINSDGKYVTMEPEDLTKTIDSYYSSFNEDYSTDRDYIFNILDQLKDKRIAEIFRERYFTGSDKMSNDKTPWSKIAKKMNLSSQTIINLHNKGAEFLRQKMIDNKFSDQI